MLELRELSEIVLIISLSYAAICYGIQVVAQPVRKLWISFKRLWS
jgi:uncharacterized protein with PhoU and TrkA domain